MAKYPENKTLLEFSSSLHTAIIEPLHFASKLYSEDIIDRGVYSRVSDHGTGLSSFDKAVHIVKAIDQKLETARDEDRELVFRTVLRIMGDLIPLDSLAERMEERYREVKSTWSPPENFIETTVTPITQDLGVVIKELTPASDKWRALGTSLKVPGFRLNSIGQNSSDDVNRLMSVINYWSDNSAESTWEVIVNALRSPLLGKVLLAEELKRKYIKK